MIAIRKGRRSMNLKFKNWILGSTRSINNLESEARNKENTHPTYQLPQYKGVVKKNATP